MSIKRGLLALKRLFFPEKDPDPKAASRRLDGIRSGETPLYRDDINKAAERGGDRHHKAFWEEE